MSKLVHLDFDPSQLTDLGREAAAAEAFELTGIIEKIKRRALEGYETLRVHQRVAVSLADTEAIGQLLTWLSHRPYVVRWREAKLNNDADATDSYVELVIGWGSQRTNTVRWIKATDELEAWRQRQPKTAAKAG